MSAATLGGADRVEVALHELAVAAALRVLAAPHGGDVVALERRAQLADVLGGEAGQRHGEIEPQADVAAAVVLEAVELLVGFVAAFAGEDFEVLERRRVDRAEAVGAKDAPGRVDDPLARHHRLRQIVAEAFERAGLDERTWHGVMRMLDAGWQSTVAATSTASSILHPRILLPRIGNSGGFGLRMLWPFFLQHGFGVFGDLLGRFEVEVVGPVVFVLAVLGRVVAADLRAGFVDAAAVVVLQVPARRCGPAGTSLRLP